MKLTIHMVGAPPGSVHEFAGPTITIGRDSVCELPLNGASNQCVSSKHARIVLQPDGAFLTDLGSTNGTFVNDRRFDGRKKLAEGDYVRLGQTGATFQVVSVDLRSAEALRPTRTALEERHVPAEAHCAVPVVPAEAPPRLERGRPAAMVAPDRGAKSAARAGQTRLMVVRLQRSNRQLLVGLALAAASMLFFGGVTLVYFLWKTHDLSSKAASLNDTAQKLHNDTENLSHSVGSVSSKMAMLSKQEEDGIVSRYADAVYLVALWDEGKGRVKPFGTAFALDAVGKFATNAHVALPVQETLARLPWVLISNGGQRRYGITQARAHPRYDSDPNRATDSPDVGLLTARLPAGEALPQVVELASEAELRELRLGQALAYIGYPVFTPDTDYSSLTKVVARSYRGQLNRLMTFTREAGSFENNFLLEHDMTSTGGASGSPIFNRQGKVVAIHNAGIMLSIPGVRVPAVGPRWCMRIDLLKELRRP